MSSNWWASKLGAPVPAPSRPASTPPTYRPAEGIRIAAQPPAPPPAYSQQHRVPVQQVEEEELPAGGQMHIMDAIRRFKGSKAANAIDSCPACGSSHIFQVTRGGVLGSVPAPRCTACGWNGLFEQGEQASWV